MTRMRSPARSPARSAGPPSIGERTTSAPSRIRISSPTPAVASPRSAGRYAPLTSTRARPRRSVSATDSGLVPRRPITNRPASVRARPTSAAVASAGHATVTVAAAEPDSPCVRTASLSRTSTRIAPAGGTLSNSRSARSASCVALTGSTCCRWIVATALVKNSAGDIGARAGVGRAPAQAASNGATRSHGTGRSRWRMAVTAVSASRGGRRLRPRAPRVGGPAARRRRGRCRRPARRRMSTLRT